MTATANRCRSHRTISADIQQHDRLAGQDAGTAGPTGSADRAQCQPQCLSGRTLTLRPERMWVRIGQTTEPANQSGNGGDLFSEESIAALEYDETQYGTA